MAGTMGNENVACALTQDFAAYLRPEGLPTPGIHDGGYPEKYSARLRMLLQFSLSKALCLQYGTIQYTVPLLRTKQECPPPPLRVAALATTPANARAVHQATYRTCMTPLPRHGAMLQNP